MDKHCIRRELKERRAALPPEEARERSMLICRNIMNMPRYQAAKAVLLYAAFGNEVNLSLLIDDAFRNEKRIFLPVMQDKTCFEAREYTPEARMEKGVFGIAEPVCGAPVLPEELDFIVAPGLGFDRCLHRVGFGAGCYDRYLCRAKNAYKVGAAYAFQIVDDVCAEGHDIPLDAVVTERDIFYRV